MFTVKFLCILFMITSTVRVNGDVAPLISAVFMEEGDDDVRERPHPANENFSILTPDDPKPATAHLRGTEYSSETSQLKVMTFNLRTSNANDPCPQGCWSERKERAKLMLEKHSPDFIGTQEGSTEQIEYMGGLGYQSFGECAGSCDSEERNSIFYSHDWELIEGKTVALSDTPHLLGSNSWNLQYKRAAVIGRFKNKKGKTVCMLNTHYDINRAHDASSRLVADKINEYCKNEDTVLMTGDLNCGPSSGAVQYLQQAAKFESYESPVNLYDTLEAAGNSGGTWIGQSYDANHVGGTQMDFIFSRPDGHSCLQDSTILKENYNGGSVSDHAVVQAEFCLGNGCTNCINA